MTGYEYGNTRLRSRAAGMLTLAEVRELAGSPDLARLLGALSATPYGPDVEEALLRATGLPAVDGAVRLHLTRVLGEARSFYDGEAGETFDLLLGRWDLRNLVALVRVVGGTPVPVLDVLVPAGTIGEGTLADLARLRGLRDLVSLLAAWRLPDPSTASRLLPASEKGALAVERALVEGHEEAVAARLGGRSDAAAAELRAEADARLVVDAVRLREARLRQEEVPDLGARPLATLPVGLAGAVVAARTREEAASLLAGRVSDRALEDWARDGDAGRLARALERDLVVRAAEAGRADPLGPGVPVSYVWAVEEEARLVRLAGRAVALGRGRSLIDEEAA